MITPLFPSREPQKRIRVVLVDDHTLFREALRVALARETDMEIVGEAGNGLTGQEVADEQRPDVVLMDLAMPVVSGIDAIRQLQRHHPEIAVIMLSSHTDEGNVLHAFKLGARGYLPKTVTLDELTRVVRIVAAGESVIDPAVTAGVLGELRRLLPREASAFGGLTERECVMLAHVAAGKPNKEIGISMHIVEHTVKNRLSIIFGKIGVQDRTQAAIYALRHGIVPAPLALPRAWVAEAA